MAKKIRGIKKIASESKGMGGRYHLQVHYDPQTGEAWVTQHIGQSWTQYHDAAIIDCGEIHAPATMAEVREMVENAIARREAWEQDMAAEVAAFGY